MKKSNTRPQMLTIKATELKKGHVFYMAGRKYIITKVRENAYGEIVFQFRPAEHTPRQRNLMIMQRIDTFIIFNPKFKK